MFSQAITASSRIGRELLIHCDDKLLKLRCSAIMKKCTYFFSIFKFHTKSSQYTEQCFSLSLAIHLPTNTVTSGSSRSIRRNFSRYQVREGGGSRADCPRLFHGTSIDGKSGTMVLTLQRYRSRFVFNSEVNTPSSRPVRSTTPKVMCST